MGMYLKRWVGFTLVMALGAETVLEVRHVGQAISPHVEVNLPPPPPKVPQTAAVTGSGPLLINVHDTITATDHINTGTVFMIRL